MFDTAVAQFGAAVTHLIPECNASTKFALAVSGGPDSVALLLLADAAFRGQIVAATVDHGLRPEATQEAEFVASLCAGRDIPHSILRPDEPITGNVQSAARIVRYGLLHTWASAAQAQWIMTAHHGDDQLETVLMRIIRGSGVDGLASIRARNGNIIRPLLGFNKSELEAICKAQSVTPVRDPSNDNTDFDRVRMRQWLAQSAHPFDARAASRSASALAQTSDALIWITEQLASERVVATENAITVDPTGLPRELQRRLLVHAILQLTPDYVARGDATEHSLDSLNAGKTVTLGTILCQGGKEWRFTFAPARRNG